MINFNVIWKTQSNLLVGFDPLEGIVDNDLVVVALELVHDPAAYARHMFPEYWQVVGPLLTGMVHNGRPISNRK